MVVYIFITNKDISFYIQTGHIQPIATIFTADHTVARLNTSDMVQLQHSHSRKSTVTLRLYAIMVWCAPLLFGYMPSCCMFYYNLYILGNRGH